MNKINPEIWHQLETNLPMGDALLAKICLPNVTPRLFCAIDSDSQRHLLVALLPNETGLDDRQSRGLIVITKDLRIHNEPSGQYIDIICRDAAGHTAFDLIGYEIADGFSKGNRLPGEVVKQVLAKWRRFWGQIPKDILPHDKQIGLFAELWFLSNWLIPKVGVSEAVRRWRGPFGARHDFEWIGKSIEVKATTSCRGRIHHIHGLNQLEPPDNGDLYLFSLRLHEEAGALHTLSTIVDACKQKIESDIESLMEFENSLAKIGYSPVHKNEYDKMRLHVIDELLFIVNGNFPRIVNATFHDGIPKGVESVEYTINLDSLYEFIIARSSDEIGLSYL